MVADLDTLHSQMKVEICGRTAVLGRILTSGTQVDSVGFDLGSVVQDLVQSTARESCWLRAK